MTVIPASGAIFLVEEQANPSTDFFVLPAVAAAGRPVRRFGFDEIPAAAELRGGVVLFVRYVPTAWVRLVEAVRPDLDRLIYFMDDDLLDYGATAGLPWRYRFKLARLAAWRRGWLRRQAAELWVSTPCLRDKYAGWNPKLILPAPPAPAPEFRRVFYHGSASHGAEIRWLRPVLEEVLRRDRRVVFEVSGGREVHRLYAGLPRVQVVHPMKWPAYQAFLSLPGRHIGLAPLLDLPFNRARSYTKFFDITRCGAVGVYAANSAGAAVVGHEVEGLVVPMEQGAWVEAISRLAADEACRHRMWQAALAKSSQLAELAGSGDVD